MILLLKATPSLPSGIQLLDFLDLNHPKLTKLEGTTPTIAPAVGTVHCWSGYVIRQSLVGHRGGHS
jgi:hypothetical protein